jgi:hypothetical protein
MANWTLGSIVFLIYIISVSIAAIAFLVWVLRHIKPKTVTPDSHVPRQMNSADTDNMKDNLTEDVALVTREAPGLMNAGVASVAETFEGVTVCTSLYQGHVSANPIP